MNTAVRSGPWRRLTVVADDLTGAADTGAAFAARGFETVVCLSLPVPVRLAADVLVMSTESRDLDEATAVARTTEVVAAARQWDGSARPVLYKKIDSTLRGHVRAEVAAALSALGVRRAVVCPAFPDQQRTTVGGRQRVAGALLEATSFGREVATSDLAETFAGIAGGVALADARSGAEVLSHALEQQTSGVVVVDAVTNDDLSTIARAAADAGVQVIVGSAGLARAMAALAPPATGRPRPASGQPRVSDTGALVVAGSRNSATVEQVREAERRGLPVLRPPSSWLSSEPPPGDETLSREAIDGIRTGATVVIATGDLPPSPGGPAAVARYLAAVARRVVVTVAPSHLVLTGGETAAAVCEAFGCRLVRITGELVPGVATGQMLDGACAGLRLVTKAGGFGGPDALVNAAAAGRA